MDKRPSREGRAGYESLCSGRKEPPVPKSSTDKREKGQWVGTYQAKARSQEEPGDLHQGPRPVANHVLNVVIETVRP